jgi:hypothetical protein
VEGKIVPQRVAVLLFPDFYDSANGGATKLPAGGVPDDDLRQTFSDWVSNVKETSADSAASGNSTSTSSGELAPSTSGKSLSVGAIVGVAIGGVVAVSAIAIFFILRRRKKAATEPEKTTVTDDPYLIQELDSG